MPLRFFGGRLHGCVLVDGREGGRKEDEENIPYLYDACMSIQKEHGTGGLYELTLYCVNEKERE